MSTGSPPAGRVSPPAVSGPGRDGGSLPRPGSGRRTPVRLRFAPMLPVSVLAATLPAASHPVRARTGIVASQNFIASHVGMDVIMDGGNAVDAAVATAFALAVTHPAAGNIGGGGFLVYRRAGGEAVAYDFRETAPAGASPTLFLQAGKYDPERHHHHHLSVGVPGTV